VEYDFIFRRSDLTLPDRVAASLRVIIDSVYRYDLDLLLYGNTLLLLRNIVDEFAQIHHAMHSALSNTLAAVPLSSKHTKINYKLSLHKRIYIYSAVVT
jgi:hypothetical protein